MKLLVLLYIGVLGVVILSIGAHYVHARVVEARCVVERLQIQSRLRRRNNGHEDLSRISPIVDADNLRGCGIGLYGGGSLGSWVAYFLSPLVGQIRVIDSDIVEPSNVAGGRTIYSKSHLGMAKSVALKQVLEGASPHLRVLAYQEDINKLSDAFLQEFLDGDLVICAVDDIHCILRINEQFYGRRPMVYGGFMRQAAEGFVCIVTENTPCFRCCMQLQGESFRTLHREPGLGLDISMVAHFMAKIIIAMLDKSEGEFAQPVRAAVQEGKNILHISNRTGLFNQEPFSLTWLAAERQRCEICNQPNS